MLPDPAEVGLDLRQEALRVVADALVDAHFEDVGSLEAQCRREVTAERRPAAQVAADLDAIAEDGRRGRRGRELDAHTRPFGRSRRERQRAAVPGDAVEAVPERFLERRGHLRLAPRLRPRLRRGRLDADLPGAVQRAAPARQRAARGASSPLANRSHAPAPPPHRAPRAGSPTQPPSPSRRDWWLDRQHLVRRRRLRRFPAFARVASGTSALSRSTSCRSRPKSRRMEVEQQPRQIRRFAVLLGKRGARLDASRPAGRRSPRSVASSCAGSGARFTRITRRSPT